ncbi:acyl-CoA dehydrogenase [Nocardioides mangrovicus]|uniref:Acyl-CoA dehydrogenase n=1 Tax=Nocardioides mangrovicus TaxID=2478913 RepID=A0A3L8P7Q1_9ACTN|nr:acyl-CoA dehydrogenase family protein [Nocardioides mangrovicus]RLV50987.1 acyl-CoA dehydrogenase [Nocardioides mangrovicus]
MDFLLDDEQQALADAVRGLLKGYDAEKRRTVTEDDPGFDEEMWKKLADMGVLGLPYPEDVGGSGAGPVEVAVVAEELGKVTAPEPFVEAVVFAGGLIAACGTAEQKQEHLAAISDGSVLPAVAWHAPDGSGEGVTVNDDGTLSGTKEPVLNGARADLLVVLAGGRLFLVSGADVDSHGSRTSYRTVDGLRAAEVVFDQTPATPLGDGSDMSESFRTIAAIARIAYGHEALGLMDTALRLTTSYLTTRKQFGVTLNTFQALTFRAADMYTSLELTRSIVTWATMVLADSSSTPAKVREAAFRSKLQVSKAGRHIGQEAIQLHGGIGMTMEYAVGHITARLTAIDHTLGDGRDMVAALSTSLTDHGVVEPLP